MLFEKLLYVVSVRHTLIKHTEADLLNPCKMKFLWGMAINKVFAYKEFGKKTLRKFTQIFGFATKSK